MKMYAKWRMCHVYIEKLVGKNTILLVETNKYSRTELGENLKTLGEVENTTGVRKTIR